MIVKFFPRPERRRCSSNVTLQGFALSIVYIYLPEEPMLTAYFLPELFNELHFCNHINAPK